MPEPAVVFGGPSSEHYISVLTGLQAVRALGAGGSDPLAIYWSLNGRWFTVPATLEGRDFAAGVPRGSKEIELRFGEDRGFFARRRLDVDVVVNACHGGPGEDGTLSAMLALAGIRCTGTPPYASWLCMDKLSFTAVCRSLGIEMLPREPLMPDAKPSFDGPLVMKPRFGGSSIGVQVVEDVETAHALRDTSPLFANGAVVEPYLGGSRDLNVAVRTYPELELSAIEAPVRSPDSAIYSHDEKYSRAEGMAGAPRELPAQLPDDVERKLRETATLAAKMLELCSITRIDFLWDEADGKLYLNEANTIPGSLAWYLWIDPHRSLTELLTAMIDEARSRPAAWPPSAAGADAAVLQRAGNIQDKLA